MAILTSISNYFCLWDLCEGAPGVLYHPASFPGSASGGSGIAGGVRYFGQSGGYFMWRGLFVYRTLYQPWASELDSGYRSCNWNWNRHDWNDNTIINTYGTCFRRQNIGLIMGIMIVFITVWSVDGVSFRMQSSSDVIHVIVPYDTRGVYIDTYTDDIKSFAPGRF